ncbi:hypothetical protein PanWU01x14_297920, partial [Parasponia andersonii]
INDKYTNFSFLLFFFFFIQTCIRKLSFYITNKFTPFPLFFSCSNSLHELPNGDIIRQFSKERGPTIFSDEVVIAGDRKRSDFHAIFVGNQMQKGVVSFLYMNLELEFRILEI